MGKPISKTEPTFESALERLEHIVEEMEGDRLPLEELLGRYEEGTKLVKVCQDRLQTAEKRIELITRSASDAAQLAPFDPSSAPAEMTGMSASSPAAGAVAPGRSATQRKTPPESSSDEVSLF
jgi:exodeoxyribonuclease VII small subunit